ncbi:MAG: hypothetical protein SGJ27_27970 [Candidatus Melainabacteria bacterium]|nr:hypothetical protein [Candidatus Melainabacteria bacterium]
MQNADRLGIQIVANGLVLPEYTKDGKTYIAAPWNTDYQIRILVPSISGYRHTYKRFKTVISVDGLDVMTGKRASAHATGYVMTPPSRPTANDILGFRLSDSEVASFHFGDRTDSYAALLEKPEHIGVIGIVFYSELDPEPCMYETTRGCDGGETTRGATRGGHDMGTEFGRRREQVVSKTYFDTDREVARFVLEYASSDSLKKAGIITNSPAPLGAVNAFPEDTGCKPPKGWRG